MESDLRTPLELGGGRDKTNESPHTPEPSRTGGTSQGGWLRRFFAFAGPAYLVSVGYMDPGNWATDIQGGAKFGYALLWVIGISNLMAMLLQTLCARLGLATGKDLAQACRDYYKRPAVIALWIGCEIAIIACDLAEVIGSAIAIKLLTGLPLTWGVLITGLDVFVLLGLMRWGFRKIEAVIMVLVGTVAVCFLLQTVLARPNLGEVAHGLFVPSIPAPEAWVIAIGILGATVMPHNLYLHSSIIKEREVEQTSPKIREAIRYATVDTLVALFLAFFVNAAILVVAGAAFHTRGHFGVEKLEDAHQLLTPILGGAAATAFAVALLASGQSSTITGTMAGQIVMEGFLHIRLQPWLRRLITRSLAIIPAILLIQFSKMSDVSLLILSQVVLSMQLPFAIFPLIAFTSDPKRMGEFVNPLWLKVVGYTIGAAISALNLYLLGQQIGLLWLSLIAACIGVFSLWVRFGYKARPEVEPALPA